MRKKFFDLSLEDCFFLIPLSDGDDHFCLWVKIRSNFTDFNVCLVSNLLEITKNTAPVQPYLSHMGGNKRG